MVCAAILLGTVGLAACGEGATAPEPTVSISVTPATATVGAGGTQAFSATVANTGNTAVTWSASRGTLTSTGPNSVDWTAPATGGPATVVATSQADANRSATANVTVTSVVVAVSPANVSLFRGQPQTFTATVTGGATGTVTWTSTCGSGTATGTTFAYSAPEVPGTCSVQATSTLDPAATASASAAIREAWLVTSGDDVTDGTCDWTHCSLREALDVGNSRAGVDTILLGPAAVAPISGSNGFGPPLPPANVSTVSPLSELPSITDDLVIYGEGSASTTIDVGASPTDLRRGLTVEGDVTLTLAGVTIRNGMSAGFGGGILLLGTTTGAQLVATDVHLLDNAANDGEGGGLALIGTGTSATLDNSVIDGNRTIAGTIVRPGGGVTVTAGTSLAMSGGSISNNSSADGWGGAIRAIDFGTITLDGVTVDGNEALDAGGGFGGGIHAEVAGSVTITGSTISNNTATRDGGGFRFVGGATLTIDGSTISDNTARDGAGVLIADAALSLTGTTFARNAATNWAGGLYVAPNGSVTGSDVDFTDNTATVSSGGALLAGTSHTFTGGTVSGNRSNFAGGFNAADGATTVDGTVFTMNQSLTGSGGGLATLVAATLVVRDAAFTDNSSAGAGGGLWIGGGAATLERLTVTGNSAVVNGGGLVAGSPDGTTISGSTIAGNSAGNRGGGINTGVATVTLTNSTISGNTAAFGGAIATVGAVVLTHGTLHGNVATDTGGGIFAGGSGASAPATLRNTLLSANTDAGGGSNCEAGNGGSFVSEDGNLSDDATCVVLVQPGDQAGTAAGIDTTLTDNGGATPTHALLTGSAAIDGGVAGNCTETDQRGAARVGTCDVGAVEFGSTPPGG